MTWSGAFPTSASPVGVGSTSPARGRPVADMLLCLLRLCMFSGNPLRAAQLFCLAWSDFPTGGGAPGLSSDVLLHPCLHHIIVMNSEPAACMLSQHVCTADHNMPSLHHCHHCTCFTLPQLYFIIIAYTKPTLILYRAPRGRRAAAAADGKQQEQGARSRCAHWDLIPLLFS
jgi:hypothetical protein